ncbi:MAG: hypothetical protein FH756_21095 [Firmicutes bacterium]|nr:hypothetical protein [Bacillota bacterium]
MANIGAKSDLLWSVFYNDFIVEVQEGELISPTHTHNHDEYLSIQIFNADEFEDGELENYVQEILYNCSIQLDLNFRRADVHLCTRKSGRRGDTQ